MPQLERFFARWQAEILAEEGYPAGLVWTTADGLSSELPKRPGLIVLVDDRDTALLVQAVEDLGDLPSGVLAAIGGASRS